MAQLINVAPPRLPTAPTQYETRFHDQHSDVLRLYFTQLSNNTNALTGPRGGQYMNNPYASVTRRTDQFFVSNTATEITFPTNDYLNGCTNNGTDGIVVQQSGLYNYQFSLQFVNTDSQAVNSWVWLRKNGVDIPWTGSKYDMPAKHGASDGYLIAVANFFVELAAGDAVSLYAATAQAYNAGTATPGVYLEAYTAQTSPFAMPAVPPAVATLSFVSSILP